MSIVIKDLKKETDNQFNLNGNNAIIAFFTTDCPHCQDASKKLGSAHAKGKTPQVFALFPGNLKDTERFNQENNGQNFITFMIDNDAFFGETAGGSFPSIFLVDKDGNTIMHWFGDTMNYTALDLIENYK